MKILHLLSGFSLIVFAAVIVISNFAIDPNTSIVIPTPRVVIKKVIKQKQVESTPTSETNLCVVTVDGVRYDITNFKNLHSGGDIFTCGSDMSATFWSQHSQRQLIQMNRYKI